LGELGFVGRVSRSIAAFGGRPGRPGDLDCMSRRELVDRLEEAASKIDELPRPALQALLRDAAQRLRNIEAATVDHEVGVAIDRLAADHGLPRSLVLSTIVRDWLVMTGRVRNVTLDEDTDTEGTA
jgi:hypothetical protein